VQAIVTFEKILNVVPERRRPGIKAVRPRIAEVIYDASKDSDLRKQIAFDPDSGFSIEDPLFRYFLTNLDPKRLYEGRGRNRRKGTALLIRYWVLFRGGDTENR
jgi:hypothetical protein